MARRTLTRPKSLSDQLADSDKALTYMAAMSGKPVVHQRMEVKEKKERRPVGMPLPGAKEAQVLSAVLAFLRLHPQVGWVQRMGVGAMESSDGRYIKFGFTGCSDIIGQMKDGRFLAVEVKREIGGKASEAQLAFIYTVKKNNGIAGVVRSLDDVVRLLEGT